MSAQSNQAAEAGASGSTAAAPSGEGGGGSKLVLILTAVNTLVTVGIIAILMISFQKDRKKPQVSDIVAAPGGEGHGAPAAAEHGAAPAAGEHGAPAEGGAAKPAHKNGEFGKMVSLEQFTVNLSTPGSVSPKFIRVNVSLEVPGDEAENEVNLKMPQVRNVIIDLFNSKRPSDLSVVEGRDRIKEEIRGAINGFMTNGKVKGVFFTNFAFSS